MHASSTGCCEWTVLSPCPSPMTSSRHLRNSALNVSDMHFASSQGNWWKTSRKFAMLQVFSYLMKHEKSRLLKNPDLVDITSNSTPQCTPCWMKIDFQHCQLLFKNSSFVYKFLTFRKDIKCSIMLLFECLQNSGKFFIFCSNNCTLRILKLSLLMCNHIVGLEIQNFPPVAKKLQF